MRDGQIKIHSIKYNFIMNVILKISMMIFPLITFPYVSRVLGAAGNGKISFATAVISYASMLALLGIPTYGIRACAQCRDDKFKLSKVVHELMFISTISMLLVYSLLIIGVFFIPQLYTDRQLILVMSMSIVLSSIGVEWFYQAIEQYQYITYRNIAFKILAILLMFIFVRDANDIVVYGGITVIGTVGSNFLNMLRLRKYIYVKFLRNYNLKKHIRPIFTFFLLTVTSTIYSNLDTVMVGFMKSDTEVGFYNAAVKIRSMLLSIVNALATVLLPRVAYYLKNKQRDRFIKTTQLAINAVELLAIPSVAFFIVFSKETIKVLAGGEYYPAIIPMMIILPTVLVAGLNNITGIQILGAMGLEKYTMYSTLCGAGLDLLLNFVMIPFYGASGAAFSTLLAEILVLIIQLISIRKYIVIKHNWGNIFKIFIASTMALLGTLMLHMKLYNLNELVILIICATSFGMIYIVLLYLLKEHIICKYIVEMILRKNAKN